MKKNLFVVVLLVCAFTGFSQTHKQGMKKKNNLIANPELHVATGHQGRVNSIAWSKDGKWIASAGADGTVRVWEAETGKELKKLTDFDSPRCVSWHIDGKILAIFTKTEVFILDILSETFIKKLDLAEDYTTGEFNPDGTKLLVNNDGIHIYDTKNYTEISFIKRNGKEIGYAYWSPNGKYIASVEDDNILRIYNVVQASPTLICSWSSNCFSGISWSSDSKYIISDNAIHNAFTGKEMQKLHVTYDDSGEISWSPNMNYIARSMSVVNYFELFIYDTKTGEKIYSRKNSGAALGNENWSPDGKYLAIAGSLDDNYFEIIEIASGNKKLDFGIKRPYLQNGLLSSDETYFVTLDTKKRIGKKGGTISIWDAMTFEKKASVDCHEKSGFAVSPDQKTLVFESVDGKLQFFDIQKQTVKKTLPKIYNDRIVPYWTRDGMHLIVSHQSNLEIYSVLTNDLIKTIKGFDVAFSPDGNYFITDNDTIVQIYKTADWNLYKEIVLPIKKNTGIEYVDKLFWDSSNRYIAILTDSVSVLKMIFLDINTETFEITAFQRKYSFNHIFWNVDESLLITDDSEQSGKIIIWDAKTGNQNYIIDTETNALISSLNLTKDRKKLISTTSNGIIQVWDFQTGDLLTTSVIDMMDEWVTYTEEGYFSGSSGRTEDFLYIVDNMKIYSLESIYESFWRPDLIAAKLRGEHLAQSSITSLSEIIATGEAPFVQFADIPDIVQMRELTVNFTVQDMGGGIGTVFISHNGKIIQLPKETKKFDLVSVGEDVQQMGKLRSFSPTISLSDGENIIEAFATNAAGKIESRHDIVKVSWHGTTAKPNLYVLAVGVNSYNTSGVSPLRYCVADAQSIADVFQKKSENIYASVNTTVLFNDKVTKTQIHTEFERLAQNVQPDDVFIFFVSGHGTAHKGDYYFISYDFDGENLDTAVSKAFIRENLSLIRAAKTLVLLDTCNAGAIVNDSGGDTDTVFARLSHSTGQAIIAASSDTQSAIEGYGNHGVFTYAVLDALSGKADYVNDSEITLLELNLYVSSTVPILTKLKWNHAQNPWCDLQKQDFPLVGK